MHIRFPAMRKSFFERQRFVHAAEDISFALKRGRTLGIVGESGSGKTTVARGVMRMLKPASGEVLLDGIQVLALKKKDLLDFRRRVQFIFQDPYSSLNPRCRAGDIIREPMDLLQVGEKARRRERVFSLMEAVGLRAAQARLFPHQFSGGQRQRIAIARALLADCPVLVLDEATSALDSESEQLVQDALATLMRGRTAIVVAHRLSTVASLDRIVVLADGKVVEDGPHAELIQADGPYAHLWSRQTGAYLE